MDMEKIMGASFGEVSNKVRAVFRKTVHIREYETEVIELETTLDLGHEVTGGERMLVSAILQAQLEYQGYCNLCFKGLVSEQELANRKEQLSTEVEILKNKVEAVLGKSMDKYFEDKS